MGPFREEEGEAQGGGAGDESPFAKFARERMADAPEPGVTQTAAPAKAEEKPLEAPVEPKDMDLASLAAALSGVKPKAEPKPKEAPRASDDEDPLVKEILDSVGPAPDKSAGTAEQFEYVKKTRAALAQRVKDIASEMEKMRKEGTSKDNPEYAEMLKEKKALEDARKTDSELIAELRRKMAVYDLREDPEYQQKYVQPIKDAERNLVQTLEIVSGEDFAELQGAVIRALGTDDAAKFRAAATEIAQSLPNQMDGVDVRNQMFKLRELYLAQQRGLTDMQKLTGDLAQSKAERRRMEAGVFMEKNLSAAQMRMEEADPMLAIMKTGPIAQILDNASGELKLVDNRLHQIIQADIGERGMPSQDMADLVVMAKQRMRERVVFQKILTAYIEEKKDTDLLREQYRRLTGKPWAERGADKIDGASGEKVESLADLYRKRFG